MTRLHVNLQVRALDDSIRFYNGLFGAEPTVRKDDYAKWMLEDPRVNFSIAQTTGEPRIEHLGIEAESADELGVLRDRFGEAGLVVEDQGETMCCYHYSDKTWVTDTHGVSWEVFFTSGEAEADSVSGSGVSTGAASDAEPCCDADCCDEEHAEAAG